MLYEYEEMDDECDDDEGEGESIRFEPLRCKSHLNIIFSITSHHITHILRYAFQSYINHT